MHSARESALNMIGSSVSTLLLQKSNLPLRKASLCSVNKTPVFTHDISKEYQPLLPTKSIHVAFSHVRYTALVVHRSLGIARGDTLQAFNITATAHPSTNTKQLFLDIIVHRQTRNKASTYLQKLSKSGCSPFSSTPWCQASGFSPPPLHCLGREAAPHLTRDFPTFAAPRSPCSTRSPWDGSPGRCPRTRSGTTRWRSPGCRTRSSRRRTRGCSNSRWVRWGPPGSHRPPLWPAPGALQLHTLSHGTAHSLLGSLL